MDENEGGGAQFESPGDDLADVHCGVVDRTFAHDLIADECVARIEMEDPEALDARMCHVSMKVIEQGSPVVYDRALPDSPGKNLLQQDAEVVDGLARGVIDGASGNARLRHAGSTYGSDAAELVKQGVQGVFGVSQTVVFEQPDCCFLPSRRAWFAMPIISSIKDGTLEPTTVEK